MNSINRNELAAEVETAQRDYMELWVKTGRRNTKAGRAAYKALLAIEERLIALDSEAQQAKAEPRLTRLQAEAREWRKAQAAASAAGNARGVFQAGRELARIYAEIDKRPYL